jgi:hypothetical protein
MNIPDNHPSFFNGHSSVRCRSQHRPTKRGDAVPGAFYQKDATGFKHRRLAMLAELARGRRRAARCKLVSYLVAAILSARAPLDVVLVIPVRLELDAVADKVVAGCIGIT